MPPTPAKSAQKVDNWMLAVIGLSNLLGRLQIGADRMELDDATRGVWDEARAELAIHDGFEKWYGEVGCATLAEGVLARDDRTFAPRAKQVIEFAKNGTRIEGPGVTHTDFHELLKPHVEAYVGELLHNSALRAAGGAAVWDELLDDGALRALDDEFALQLGTGTPRERFKRLLSVNCLNQIASQDLSPLGAHVARVWKEPERKRLQGTLGCEEDELVAELILRARRRLPRVRSSEDLMTAERLKIMIADLVRTAADAVLSILSQAKAADGGDRQTADCILASLLAIRHNYREAVGALLGHDDVFTQYGVEFMDRLLEILKAGKGGLALNPLATDQVTSSLTRAVALVLEAVQFYPFGPQDAVDLTAVSLTKDTSRRQELLPVGSQVAYRPVSREEFVERLRENLEVEEEWVIEPTIH